MHDSDYGNDVMPPQQMNVAVLGRSRAEHS
jgi:hypothetical protein